METTKEGTRPEDGGDAQRDAGDELPDAGAHGSGTARELNDKAQQLYADLLGVGFGPTLGRWPKHFSGALG
ncbi:hypothetical protein PQR75_42310 [Paraburkholderia fungorum]|jgi:hypothetical protein|uniref:hypothetical protein n=1 Tax=Paraburkholderia TaxID=1822464 RepID=UPI0038BC2C8F